ncbi:ATP-dependent helicase [Actinotalea lenta]|uniref:ATP-dependent helicase n=1 Tax=Actinotalea lenta TaxID=3064654 RepID=UPI003D9C7203
MSETGLGDTAAGPDPSVPDGFSGPTRDWFAQAFAAPTAVQSEAWDAVGAGEHALVVAPTGSGKTLAAFLWSLDGLLTQPPPEDPRLRCRVLYVSPLKALAADVERNLRAPLVGIRRAAARHGRDLPDVRVGVRTGDTPAAERRAFATRPPDILITTPESLFLVLTSAARAGLAGVRTVILDEIHAVAGTKRGAHLAVSMERLDALLEEHDGPAQRIGLSATVRPVQAVAEYLAGARSPAHGGRGVRVVQPPSSKQVEVDVVVPVPDLTDLPGAPGTDVGEPDLAGAAAARPRRPSIWPHVEERVVDLVTAHRSTLVFTNSRRASERLTARMNEVWAARQGDELPDHGALVAAEATAQSGTAVGAPGVLARAHHGSMSRAERVHTEDELKAGRLPAVVATSSLELGIDMGAVDLVVQVGAPPSVASGLQRIGRAGHQVGAVSHGVVFPTFRGELVPSAVIAERMRAGQIEELRLPSTPLDVLAQHVVAMVATRDWDVDELASVVRRAAPFATLGDGALRAVLDMLAGRYPSEDFAELRPRLVWDRSTGRLSARPGALRLAATSGGTIPDRGLYGVFLAGGDRERTARGGLRVGELDEEMVYESRVGDTFTLGSSTWRIEDITPDRVLVTPAPGLPGRLPFWKGDSPGRPAELGRAIGAWLRETAALPADQALARAVAAGLDPWAADNLVAYLAEQREATGRLPDDTTVVVERFRDELGDWRVVVHSPFGARVHAPWALVIAGRLRDRYGLDAAVMHSDDGIVLRLPDAVAAGEATWDASAAAWSAAEAPPVDLADLLVVPEDVVGAVQAELGSSTIFAARFREAAARALLLPRRRPDRRQPLWQQRHRSAQLLQVASAHPDFPILLEAARECLQDDFDTAGLTALMADVAARRVSVVEVTTPTPSPFAQSLLFGYTAQFLYDGDAPLAERRAAALTLDPALLAELLAGDATPLADLLDPAAVQSVEAEVSRTAPDRRAVDLEQLVDVLRRHGPLDLAEVRDRTVPEQHDAVPGWLASLVHARRILRVRCAGREQWAVAEDAARLRDALGVALPSGVPAELAEPVPDPLGDLVRRHARTHGPFTVADVAERFALPGPAVVEVLRRLERDGAVAVGRLRPESIGGTGEDHCDVDVLRRMRRRSLAALRSEVEPVPPRALARFLPEWQHVSALTLGDDEPRRVPGRGLRGVDGLARVIEQLAGFPVPASALESLVLPARVTDYSPAMLDELTSAGEVVWAGHAALAARDGLVSLHPAATADLTLPAAATPASTRVLDALRTALSSGGGWFFDPLVARVAELTGDAADPGAVADALWDLVWAAEVTNDGVSPLRARLGGPGRTVHRVRGRPPRAPSLRTGIPLRPSARAVGPGRPDVAGRWSLLPARETDPTVQARATAAQLLDRHGVLTRAVAGTEAVADRFGAVYRVLAALEESGSVRRGYFVEHLGGSQFALPGAVDELRRSPGGHHAVALAATDPANPFGAALPWPSGVTAHRPGRTAGALVVLVDGDLVLYLERGGRTVLSFPTEEAPGLDHLAAGARCLADLVRTGRLGRVTLRRVDGAEVLDREVLAGPVAQALTTAGFAATPRGLRLG